MSTPHRLLFATDFSRCSEQAFEHALWWATTFSAELEIVHCLAGELDGYDLETLPVTDVAAQRQAARSGASTALSTLVATAGNRGVVTRSEVLEGSPVAQVICDYATAKKVGLVVLGTHGRRGLGRLFLGSVAEQVVRRASCPVFTVHEREGDAVPKVSVVVAPVDFSEGARRGARWALKLARKLETPLHLVHVLDPALEAGLFMPGAFPLSVSSTEQLRAAARESLERLRAELVSAEGDGPAVELTVLYGSPPYEITELAATKPGAWIVMTTQSHTGLERLLLGSTAERVLRLAPCPVVTLGRQATEATSGLVAV